MAAAMATAMESGVRLVVFGDLFLADVRAYRERALAGSGIVPLFPLWARPTPTLAQDMVAARVRAVLTCVDPKQLPAGFVGRSFDQRFLADLPPAAGPRGESR